MAFRPTILHFESIDSTNLEAIRQAKAGAPEGLCVTAREQTAGRGRLNRSWQSPRDAGLYLSIVLRPKIEIIAWPLISLMAALAAIEALSKECQLLTDIKWPNDLCVNERKLGGILAETLETTSGPAVILGIGINLLRADLGERVRDLAISVEEATKRPPDAVRILESLLNSLSERYELLNTDAGREHIIREWCANSSYAFDRQVAISFEGNSFVAITRGLENDGALRVETADGKIRSVRAGEVTAVRASGGF